MTEFPNEVNLYLKNMIPRNVLNITIKERYENGQCMDDVEYFFNENKTGYYDQLDQPIVKIDQISSYYYYRQQKFVTSQPISEFFRVGISSGTLKWFTELEQLNNWWSKMISSPDFYQRIYMLDVVDAQKLIVKYRTVLSIIPNLK